MKFEAFVKVYGKHSWDVDVEVYIYDDSKLTDAEIKKYFAAVKKTLRGEYHIDWSGSDRGFEFFAEDADDSLGQLLYELQERGCNIDYPDWAEYMRDITAHLQDCYDAAKKIVEYIPPSISKERKAFLISTGELGANEKFPTRGRWRVKKQICVLPHSVNGTNLAYKISDSGRGSWFYSSEREVKPILAEYGLTPAQFRKFAVEAHNRIFSPTNE